MSERGGVNWTEKDLEDLYARRQKGGDAPRPESGSTPTTYRARNAAPVASTAGAKKSRMNRWEQQYALELDARKHAGEVIWWGFEAMTLRLGFDCRYTPDFSILEASKQTSPVTYEYPALHFVEIKGFLRGDADVKFRVAAEQFPFAKFSMLRKQKGGGWELIKHLNGGAK